MNPNKIAIILRGVSGSGKSSFAEYLRRSSGFAWICTADDFFSKTGDYLFEAEKLGEAHEYCRDKFEKGLKMTYSPVICANTNATETECKVYFDLAKKYGYEVFSLVVENRHGNKNLHNVPEHVLKKQEARLKNSLKLI